MNALQEEIEVALDPNSPDQLISYCRKLVAEWSDVEVDLICSRLTGGETNVIFKVERTDEAELSAFARAAVIVRIFGPGTSQFMHRWAYKAEICQIPASIGLGPRILCKFQNGCVEEFIPGSQISPADLLSNETLLQKLATTLASLHAEGTALLRYELKENLLTEEPVWTELEAWYRKAESVIKSELATEHCPMRLQALRRVELSDTIHALLFDNIRTSCKAIASPLVFCHRDVHAGNIIFDRAKNDSPILIDYEYSALAPRAFDLANFFAEFAGFENDYSKLPTRKQRREFCKNYLGDNSTDIDLLEEEIRIWTAVVYAYWALWGIIRLNKSTDEFNYLSFALCRLNAFKIATHDMSASPCTSNHNPTTTTTTTSCQ